MKGSMKDRLSALGPYLTFVGGMSGLLALLTIIFRSGAIAEQVETIRRDIVEVRKSVEEIRSGGSIPLREHVKEDLAFHAGENARINRLEDISLSLPASISRLDVTINLIKEKVDKL